MAGMTVSLWLAAGIIDVVGNPAPRTRPLHLVTEPVGAGIRVRVVGESPVACEAHYVLEVASDPAEGANRSVQRGAARLGPGVATTIATVTLANAGSKAWTARLGVEPCGGAKTYEETTGATR
jgi:hypothetical protein